MRDFSKKIRKIIDPFLFEKGFSYSGGQYVKESPNGIRYMIAFDNGGIDKESFNILVFINSVELDDDKGAYCVSYFTGGSLSETSRKLPCNNEVALNGRLQRFIDSFDSVVAPYLEKFQTCENIAKELESNPGLSSYRGDLYFCSGNKKMAKKEYKNWIEHVQTLKYLDEGKIKESIDETRKKIKKCRIFALA